MLIISLCLYLSLSRPPKIVDELYPHCNILSSNIDSTNINNEKGNVQDKSGDAFDKAVLDIVNIIISYDMGWSKRGNGRNYDSLNGYGAIIGFLSGKVLDFATRNRKCKLCDTGHPQDDHDCSKNFVGSAKAMEPSVGAELVNNSPILEEAKVKVRVVIGDEDSSTIAAIRRGNPNKIFKLADYNHLKKNFNNDLYALQPKFKEMKRKEVIPHLRKCFGHSIFINKGNVAQLKRSLHHFPEHLFDCHENCGNWCKRKLGERHKQTVLFNNPELREKLQQVYDKYANNAEKFSINASSQGNEALNGIMAQKCPKNRNYSTTASSDVRFASSVLCKNEGPLSIIHINSKLSLSPGKHTVAYLSQQDKASNNRTARAKLPATKCRRNLLVQMRKNLRVRNEQREGVQYQSNCGMEMTAEDSHSPPDYTLLDKNLPSIPISVDTCNIVYFDLETSGLSNTAQILQIAAKFGNKNFNVYITPTQEIYSGESEVTGLQNINGDLFLRGHRVESLAVTDALGAFN